MEDRILVRLMERGLKISLQFRAFELRRKVMNYRGRRIVFTSVVALLVASTVSPQQTNLAVLSASGTSGVTLKVKAFKNNRHFIVRAAGNAVQSSTDARFSLGIRVTDDNTDDKDFKAYGCGVQNTAELDKGTGKLHVETSCEIVVEANKMVTITADPRISGAKPENITLEATSAWQLDDREAGNR